MADPEAPVATMDEPHLPNELLVKILENIPFEGHWYDWVPRRAVCEFFKETISDPRFPVKIMENQYSLFAEYSNANVVVSREPLSSRRKLARSLLRMVVFRQPPLRMWKQHLLERGVQRCVIDKALILAEGISFTVTELQAIVSGAMHDTASTDSVNHTEYVTVLFFIGLIEQLPKEAIFLWAHLLDSMRKIFDSKYLEETRLEVSGTEFDDIAAKSFTLSCSRDVGDVANLVLAPLTDDAWSGYYREYVDNVVEIKDAAHEYLTQGPPPSCEQFLLFPGLFLFLTDHQNDSIYLPTDPAPVPLALPARGDSNEERLKKLANAHSYRLWTYDRLSLLFENEKRAKEIAKSIDLRTLSRTIERLRDRLIALSLDEIKEKVSEEVERLGTGNWLPSEEDAESDAVVAGADGMAIGAADDE